MEMRCNFEKQKLKFLDFVDDICDFGLTEEIINKHKTNFPEFIILIDIPGKYIKLLSRCQCFHCFLDFEQENSKDRTFTCTDKCFEPVLSLIEYSDLFARMIVKVNPK